MSLIRRYVEQIFNIFNFVDGIVLVDKESTIQYYANLRPDLNNISEKEVLGKKILDIYTSLDKTTSSVWRVLKTGIPITNEYQVFTTFKGTEVRATNTTLPIMENGEVIGVVDVSSYERNGIKISKKELHDSNDIYKIDDIITCSKDMIELKEKILKVAKTDSTVLIYGQTGTGKELIAQSIHSNSLRKNNRFISQNCAAIPHSLLESILFGTVKGGFTGAEDRAGLFELADGGTLFLDEINSMELSIQPKLLKVIEEKEVTRVGGSKAIKFDVKIISAVNENPTSCVKNNKLREDLFYRLSVVQVMVPSLNQRRCDIKYLTDYFIKEYNSKMNKSIIDIDEEVENIFSNYNWPGNVRELKNVIEGAFNLVTHMFIQKKDLPQYLINAIEIKRSNLMSISGNESLQELVESYEKSIVDFAVKNSKTYTDAAEKLKISKQALYYKIKKYKI